LSCADFFLSHKQRLKGYQGKSCVGFENDLHFSLSQSVSLPHDHPFALPISSCSSSWWVIIFGGEPETCTPQAFPIWSDWFTARPVLVSSEKNPYGSVSVSSARKTLFPQVPFLPRIDSTMITSYSYKRWKTSTMSTGEWKTTSATHS
jgi:hypothetical protein